MALKPPNEIGQLIKLISHVYDGRLSDCGPSANGVYWKNEEGQALRHEVLLRIIEPEDLAGGTSINDLGCGYGALFDMIRNEPLMNGSAYWGYDVSPDMVKAARQHANDSRAIFLHAPMATETADYTFASGTFNMSLNADEALWSNYIRASVRLLWQNTRKGLAFNMLDAERSEKLPDLFYADLDDFVAFAKTLTPNVEVVDDYPLDEWTLFMRRPKP